MAYGQAKSATFILKKIQAGEIKPSQLTCHHRKICVRYFLEEDPGVTREQMAQILGTSVSSVKRYVNQVIEQDGWIVDRMDPRLYASKVRIKFETWISKIEQKARQSQSLMESATLFEKASRLEIQLLNALMELGMLKRAPIEVNGHMTLLEIIKHANASRGGAPIFRPAEEILADGKELEGVDGIRN